MNLIQFAFNNVIRNKKAYFAYFLSCSISAAMFFSFTMFILHPNLNSDKMPEDAKAFFATAELVAYAFLVLFIFYSVNVFLKNRNKEFGTLFIIGISKKQLAKIMFMENIIIIGLAAAFGIIFGMSFSKFLLVAISVFVGFEGIGFYFPISAILITLGAFLLLGILISLFTFFVIRENQVLKLLKGSKTPKKEPKTSPFFALLAVILLSGSYYFAVTAKREYLSSIIMPVTIATIIATYFIYSELSVFILNCLKKNRKVYAKKTNLIWISKLFYRVKDNVIMFFIITITSSVAFTSIGALYAYKISNEKSIISQGPQAILYSIFEIINKDSHYKSKLSDEEHKKNIKFIEDNLKDDGVNYTKFVGEKKGYEDSRDENNLLTVMRESDYNKLASSLKLDTINLKDKEAFKIAEDKTSYVTIEFLKPFNINGQEFKIVGEGKRNVLTGFYANAYVISDELFNNMSNYSYKENYYVFYVEEWYKALNASKRIYDKIRNDDCTIRVPVLEYVQNRKDNGLIMLVALFIGIIFFFTTGSFLYNKFYMDASEDKIMFKNMNKIGVSYKDIKKIITIELGALFLIPYIVAVVHSSFALSALKSSHNMEVTMSAFLVMGSFFLIQIVYFIVIRATYLKEIKRELI